MAAVHTTHGRAHTPEYKAWRRMKSACFNPKHPKYPRYGGRGITVCAEWVDDFAAFFTHAGPRPSPKHSIDRIENDGHYEPGNVRWATAKEQANNKSNTRRKEKP